MRFRKLRIALSAMCAISCLLLSLLWIRSYWYFDVLDGILPQHKFSVLSACGQMRLTLFTNPHPNDWEFSSSNIEKGNSIGLAMGARGVSQIYLPNMLMLTWTSDRKINWFPILLPTYLFGVGAALPWIKQPIRFRIRTLLIATVFVSVALVLMNWSV